MSDLYGRLKVSRDASVDDIRRSYKTLAKEVHPDRGGNAEEFKSIQEAHEILTDPSRRRMYDVTGSTQNEAGGPGGGMAAGGIPFSFMGGMGPFGMPGVQFDIGDMFGNIFGGGGPGRSRQRGGKGPNKFHDISLRLSDYYTGKHIKLKFNQGRRCNGCNGSGAESTESCGPCGGSGVRTQVRMLAPGMMAQSRGPCDVCNGEGTRTLRSCRTCQGKRFTEREKELDINIAPGMHEGELLTFTGECSDSMEFDTPGDVVLTLRCATESEGDEKYIWKDDDLHVVRQITFAEAILGFTIQLKAHPNGKAPTFAWTSGPLLHGAVVQAVGLGMPRKAGGFGNLFITIAISAPPTISWTAPQLVALQGVLGGNPTVFTSGESVPLAIHVAEPRISL